MVLFGATVNDTFPGPLELGGETLIIQGELLTAVQGHPDPVFTATCLLPPAELIVIAGGFSE